MKNFLKKNLDITAGAVLFSIIFFMVFTLIPRGRIPFIGEAWANQSTSSPATTLSVTIAAVLTFSVDNTSVSFGTLTPGTPKIATTTLSVATNNASGWFVTMYGNSQSPTDTVMDLSSDASNGLTDQTEWVDGSATTTGGNAVLKGSLDSSGAVLAFRAMSASGTTAFLSTQWWGSGDDFLAGATSKWAGIASSTINRSIGNSDIPSKTPAGVAGTALNTVQYYLDVPVTQMTGSYDGQVTFAAATNP